MNTEGQKLRLSRRKKKSHVREFFIAAIAVVFAISVFGFVLIDPFGLFNRGQPTISQPDPNREDVNTVLPPEVELANRKEGVYSFLVVGLDNPKNSRNTDVLMLCNFDTENGGINILQIPRDSYVIDPLMPTGGKLNNVFNRAAADYEEKNPGASDADVYHYAMDYLCKKVSSLFCVPIDFHISFNTLMYRELLELVCPITVNVPFDMDYDDPTQDLHIHLKAGVQQLDPEQAEGFSRFRQNNDGSGLTEGDFSRVDLQKITLAAIAEKFLTETTLPNAHAVVGSIINNIETDLTLDNCVWFMQKALSLYASGTMTLDSIRMYDLPCKVPSPAECQRLLGINYLVSYGFMEKSMGYTLEVINKAFNLTEVEITAEMLGYEEAVDLGGYCDHSDTLGHSIQEILTAPPDVHLYG